MSKKMKYYDMDRAMLVRTSRNVERMFVRLAPNQKSDAWTPAQQRDLSFLADQIQALMSVVNHLNEIVQNGGE